MYLLNRSITLIFVFILMPLAFYAQSKNYIYIQSERKQPFYVVMNNKNNSSTVEGYLILSQITKGKHLITVGFPKNLYPEQKFYLDISEDRGYSLKKSSNNTWQLFDMNNFTIIDPITNIDSILEEKKPVVAVETKKLDTIAPVKEVTIPLTDALKSSDSIVVIHKPDTIVPVINFADTPLVKTEIVKTVSTIKLILDKVQASGIDKIFVDSTASGIDTIDVYIPLPARHTLIKTASGDTTQMVNANPEKIMLTDDEYRKLRLSMASAATDEDMIAVAVRSTANKVIHLRQLKSLSSLFLTESNKVTFFKAMKGNLKESTGFASLESELSEPKNIAAFKLLLNH